MGKNPLVRHLTTVLKLRFQLTEENSKHSINGKVDKRLKRCKREKYRNKVIFIRKIKPNLNFYFSIYCIDINKDRIL